MNISKSKLAIIVLTFNSAKILRKTLDAALNVSSFIVVIDSGSSDDTIQIANQYGCVVHHRQFLNYSDQRNWAIKNFGAASDWQLHLDADEVLDEEAVQAIKAALAEPEHYAGFLLRRRTYFLGQPLRFGGTMSWHLRLFKAGFGSCEDRLYDQHFICQEATRKIPHGFIHDMNMNSLSEWTNRHNRWSDAEVKELLRQEEGGNKLAAKLSNDPRQRRRFYKGFYYKSPRLLRAMAYFIYRYVIMGGFLDGRIGFIYAVLQALWFRVLVDAKLIENDIEAKS